MSTVSRSAYRYLVSGWHLICRVLDAAGLRLYIEFSVGRTRRPTVDLGASQVAVASQCRSQYWIGVEIGLLAADHLRSIHLGEDRVG